jgi:large subunit ribosomal protein L10
VSEIADLPSKEELVGKFLFLLNHPISSFARVLNAIAEKQGSGDETSEVEETTEE